MKSGFAFLLGFMAICMTAHGRQIKSADGSKTMKAEFVRYDVRAGNVTLQVEAGRNLVVPASRFSKDDIAYFLEQQKAVEQKEALRVTVDEKSDNVSNKRGKILYKSRKSQFKFMVSNSSGFEFKNLTVNHWVVVERGSKSVQVLPGTKLVSSLPAKGGAVVEGPAVELSQSAVSKDSMGCPKVAARAAAVGRDRIIGTKIQILDSSGKEIFSKKSSNSVDPHLPSVGKR